VVSTSYFTIFRFFFSSRRRHTRFSRDWSSDVCSSDLGGADPQAEVLARPVAEVNGHPISAAELQSVYRNNLAIYRQFFGQLQPAQNEEILYQSLEGLIRNRLMLEAARRENVQVDGADVKAELRS